MKKIVQQNDWRGKNILAWKKESKYLDWAKSNTILSAIILCPTARHKGRISRGRHGLLTPLHSYLTPLEWS